MSEELVRYEITAADKRKDKLLKRGALALPPVAALVPATAFFIPFLLATTVPGAAMFLFLSMIQGVGSIRRGSPQQRPKWH